MTISQELRVQRKVTDEFIARDPTDIALIPHTRIKNNTGGWTALPGTPRVVQTFKLIALSVATRPTVVQDGVERVADYTLLGSHDAIMAVGDTWTGADGRRYEIIATEDGHGYQTKGLVMAHG